MRLAWFSPLPPQRSGIAAHNADLLAILDRDYTIDRFVDTEPRGRTISAHDFVWRHRQAPYDLVVYQLGNFPAHDYIWAYLAAYPGLVVVHDPLVHHARARQLLSAGRADDYRREFQFDHPGAPPEFAEYIVQGMGGSLYYFYSMLRVPIESARLVAVHNPRVADDVRATYPGAAIDAIRLGMTPLDTSAELRTRVRETLGVPDGCVLFASFGKITEAKRIGPILRAFEALVRDRAAGVNAHLLLAGEASDYPFLDAHVEATGVADRIHVTGYLDDDAIGGYLSAADVCLCLRWPTALETSGSWLQCLAAERATVITDLAHQVDIPSTVALRVDPLEEEPSLQSAMWSLATDDTLRAAIARAGHTYWAAHHTLEATASDYRRIIARAAAQPVRPATHLPAHFLEDYSRLARGILKQFEVKADLPF